MRRLQDPIDVERLLAVSRLALAAACLLPALTGSAGTLFYDGVVTALLLGYAIYSVVVLTVVRLGWLQPPIPFALHVADFAWAFAIVLLSNGADSPFVALFLLPIFSAAFRWRLNETILTGAAAVAALLLHARIFGAGELLVVCGTGLGVAAVLVGLLSEYEKSRREQTGILAELLRGVQAQRGFRLALKFIADALLRLSDSEVFLVAAREFDSNRAVLWTATRAQNGTILLAATELAEGQRHLYFFQATGDACSVVRRRRDTCTLTAIDRDGDTIPAAACDLGGAFWQFHQHQAALAVSVSFGGAWRGRVLLLRDRRYTLAELRFLHRAVGHVVPSLHNHYLWRRLRSRAGAAERRLVARHLARIEHLLGEEARAVRDVMHQIRSFEAGPGQFVPALAGIVERFERDTGIRAKLYAGPQDIYVPPRASRELARTLQDVLTNVRRHAGARKVEVEFRADAEAWRLDVENDGRPFGFVGRLALDELEARRLGPRVIKERVREMGGDLVIESSEKSGVRLEISLPRPEGQFKSA